MKNTLLDYEYEELDEFIVPNYFSRDINIYDIYSLLKKYVVVYRITDNDNIERIAYDLYGTTDYWDILVMLNQRNPLFDMPYNYDKIEESTKSYTNTYLNVICSIDNLHVIAGVGKKLYDEYLEEGLAENESFRYMYVVEPTKMADFLKVLQDNSYL